MIPAVSTPDATRFVGANRIHIAGGSLFLDPYLVVHPREMAPSNDKQLRSKLELTFGLNNPSFYESTERLPIALNLATLMPVSLEAKRSSLMRAIDTFNQETRTRTDSDLAQDAADRARPFGAIVRDTMSEPSADPVGMEVLKNGLVFYMLLRESLTRHGYLGRLNEYVRFSDTPDQILTSLQDKIGIASETLMDAARTQGLTGIAKQLGLEPAYLQETQQLIERAATKEFSYNMVEHWHIGRQLLKNQPNATIDDKIAVGFERRILDTMAQLKAKSKGQTDVPNAIKAKERWVAEGLGLVPDIQRQLLWDLGYELCYTDEPTADKIAFHPSIYGLHRTTKDSMNDVRGTYRIYFGSKGDPEGSHRTLVHEITHNLWPSMFTTKETAELDQFANADRTRIKRVASTLRSDFPTFKNLMLAYHAANATPQQKAAVLQQANERYANTLGPLNALFAENKNPYEVLDMAEHADQRLHVDGLLYKQSGYHGPQERFREVISRYAELRYVRLREEPALLNFIAPGLTRVYDGYYLPHLQRLHDKIVSGQVSDPRRHIAADAIAAEVAVANDNNAEKKSTPQPAEKAADVAPLPQPDTVGITHAESGEKLPQPEQPGVVGNDNGKPVEQKDVRLENPVSVEPPKVEEPQIKETQIGPARVAADKKDSHRPTNVVQAKSAVVRAGIDQLDRLGVDVYNLR